jgi:hypothetical protein
VLDESRAEKPLREVRELYASMGSRPALAETGALAARERHGDRMFTCDLVSPLRRFLRRGCVIMDIRMPNLDGIPVRPFAPIEATVTAQKSLTSSGSAKPSDGLEPSTPSLP